MIGTLAKLKEICEWWKERYDNFYSFLESLGNVDPDCLTQEVKREFTFEISRLTIDLYTNELIDLTDEAKDTAEYIPQDVKSAYWELHAEMLQIIGKHIRKMKDLKFVIEAETTNCKQIEYCIDSAYDYFITRFDELKGALNCLKIDKSIREILKDEDREETEQLKSETYRNKLISMYQKGLEDIEAYLNEHASEHDGYRIRLDVAEIIRDVEKAVDKAGEL